MGWNRLFQNGEKKIKEITVDVSGLTESAIIEKIDKAGAKLNQGGYPRALYDGIFRTDGEESKARTIPECLAIWNEELEGRGKRLVLQGTGNMLPQNQE